MRNLKSILVGLGALLLLAILLVSIARAEALNFVWDAHPGQLEINHFRFYADKVDVAHIVQPSSTELAPTIYSFDKPLAIGGHTFWVTAVNQSGLESKRSNAVIYVALGVPPTPTTSPPIPPTGLKKE